MEPIRLLIAGAPKTATTSLLAYLDQHPDICCHPHREFGYFVQDGEYETGYAAAYDRYFVESADRLLFAKSVQVMYQENAMARLRDHNADVELVLVLRHPVDRAYSEYWYARRRGWEGVDNFAEAVSAESLLPDAIQPHHDYLDRSTYIKHIRGLLEYFPRAQLHIFIFEDIRHHMVDVCQDIFRLFPQIDASFTPDIVQRHNMTATARFSSVARLTSTRSKLPRLKRFMRQLLPPQTVDRMRDRLTEINEKPFTTPPLDTVTRQHLADYFAPYNRELEAFLDRDLSCWN
jgi:hypothetical protein